MKSTKRITKEQLILGMEQSMISQKSKFLHNLVSQKHQLQVPIKLTQHLNNPKRKIKDLDSEVEEDKWRPQVLLKKIVIQAQASIVFPTKEIIFITV